MPDIQNTFIKSKMNKDLDARILPAGEYRDAVNIAVNKSEGADAGALENILGNLKLTDFGLTDNFLEVIGHCEDLNNNRIFVFLSNYTDSSTDKVSNFAPSGATDVSLSYTFKGAACYICCYNTVTGISNILAQGNFLNFSKVSPIVGVDLIENLLFWTDNRNQPRKINIDTAISDPTYYSTEDSISVSKYYPWECITFLDNAGNSTLKNESDQYLPFHTISTINSFTGNNQIILTAQNSLIAVNDKVYSPDNPEAGFAVVTTFINQAVNPYIKVTYQGQANADMSSIWSAPNGLEFARPNPDYDSNFPGDPEFLNDKFPRFSYRFKFDDGEYSLMAPFSQPAFIPDQYGSFAVNDETNSKESGIVKFMQNWVDTVGINIPLPAGVNNTTFNSTYKVEEIDILYKDSSSQGVYVIESIPTGVGSYFISQSAFTNYIYSYKSQVPNKILPESELIRVHDKAPIRAAAQATSGNRVIYGNFYDKHTSPDFLNYELRINEKTALASSNIRKELPNHTVKQNRTYQVGVVLIDRYGRPSDVILRDPNDTISTGWNQSSIFARYTNGGTTPWSWPGNSLKINFLSQIPSTDQKPGYPGLYSASNPLGWYSYKIVVKQQEQEYYNVYLPGSTSGNINWPGGIGALTYSNTSNVANIALYGDNINKVPKELSDVGPTEETFGSKVQLYNRVYQPNFTSPTLNIQGPLSVKAHDVVSIQAFRDLGTWTLEKSSISASSYPSVDPFFRADDNPYIATVSTDFRVGYTNTVQTSGPNFSQDLIVYETKPVLSNLDIFWETTTSGLISDLNTAIANSVSNQNVDALTPFSISIREDMAAGSDITNIGFEALNGNGSVTSDPTATMVLDRVEDGTGALVDKFELYESTPSSAGNSAKWKIRTKPSPNAKYLAYTTSSSITGQYVFYLTATANSSSKSFSFPAALSNITPNITSAKSLIGVVIPSGGTVVVNLSSAKTQLIRFEGFNNGSVDPNRSIEQCTFYIDSVIDSNGNDASQYFTLDGGTWPQISSGANGPVVRAKDNLITGGQVTITVKLTDCWEMTGLTSGTFNSPPALQASYSFTAEII